MGNGLRWSLFHLYRFKSSAADFSIRPSHVVHSILDCGYFWSKAKMGDVFVSEVGSVISRVVI